MAKGGKKVLIIHGSPRKEGNTDILLREIVKGIKGENKEVELREIYLRELRILPCQECRVCNRSGRCIIKDDMQELSTELREADYIILGSPIFFYTVTTYVKAMIDRGQVFWVRKYLWKQSQAELTGNPVEMPPEKPNRAVIRGKYDLEPDRFTVLVTGGSQGASSINNAVIELLKSGDFPENAQIFGKPTS